VLNVLLKLVGLDLLLRVARGGIRGLRYPLLGAAVPLWHYIGIIFWMFAICCFVIPGFGIHFFEQHLAFPLAIACFVLSAIGFARRRQNGQHWFTGQRPPTLRTQAYRRRNADVWATGRKRSAHVKRDGKYFPWSGGPNDKIPF
jgi:hypothetical protein